MGRAYELLMLVILICGACALVVWAAKSGKKEEKK